MCDKLSASQFVMILLDIKILSKIESCQMPARSNGRDSAANPSDLYSLADCLKGAIVVAGCDIELEAGFRD
jgi:hypothetical protein